MLFYVTLDGSSIVGYDQLQLAKRKGSELKRKYPEKIVKVVWSHFSNKKRCIQEDSITIEE